ncbi:MAG: XamI family restriction endonuclease, partial [Vulcanimicrobiaceae bacterium]
PGVVSENEVQFGPERGDVLARLLDDRMMPIECKVSNSAVNSYKRLNHDTLAKHVAWIRAFGESNVVPVALLAGVYSPTNVITAQAAGLTIFWSHRISDLGAFVEGTRK